MSIHCTIEEARKKQEELGGISLKDAITHVMKDKMMAIISRNRMAPEMKDVLHQLVKWS